MTYKGFIAGILVAGAAVTATSALAMGSDFGPRRGPVSFEMLDVDGNGEITLDEIENRAEARFSTDAGAGEYASYFKKRGFRLMLHPVILDEGWWAPFRDGPVPDGQRWHIPIGAEPPVDTYEGHANWPWACGRAYTEGGTGHLPKVKICLASWDRQRMDAVLAALTRHPRCFGVKGNHPRSSNDSFLGRAVFLDAETTGWVTRQLEEQCPDVVPVVQDDSWFSRYRNS